MKNATPSDESSVLTSKDTSAHTQCLQILSVLKTEVSMNTLELREIGFISPAPRILELKQQGYNIISVREDVRTRDGRLHRGIARYYLKNSLSANDSSSEVAA